VRAFSLKFPERRFEVHEIETIASPIPVDAERFEQVLDNILSNAVKYSPSDQPITISSFARNDVYLVRIEDRGKGMTPEEVAQVFEKFFRADTSNTALGGLGLGMSITRGIIEAHGGEIWVESEPGRGTKVSFTLPLNGD
jgi:signal transduction histidine kinase